VKAQAPSRLFLDASGEAAWRRKGFTSVLDAQGNQAALMARMLELGRGQPLTPNAKLPSELEIGIGRENTCPLPEEFDRYA
ncbi:fatty acid cis/trans isomerase, partial [Pseudomonas sp. 65/3-MNA-CIBAN-0223]